MGIRLKLPKARQLSWLFSAASVIAPLTIFAMARPHQSPVPMDSAAICGMPYMLAALVGFGGMVLCSIFAFVFGVKALLNLSEPRPSKSILEFNVVVGLPYFLLAAFLIAIALRN